MSKEEHRKIIERMVAARSGAGEASTPRKPKPEVETKLTPTGGKEYPEGHQKFSEVFGFKPPSGVDHAVRVFEREDWPEDLQAFIPAVDDGHVWAKKETEVFVAGLMSNDKTLLHGPKGSGKSSLPTQVCARLNIPMMRVNGRADMESSALFGQPTVEEGTLKWVPGPAEVLGKGGGLLLVDEISAIPAGISMAMQWMLEENGKIFLPDKPSDAGEKFVEPHDWFRVVATDNTELQGDTNGRYVGAQVQNEALVDRFSTTIKVDYLTKAHEIGILTKRVEELPKSIAEAMVDFAGMVRTSYNQDEIQSTLSPRGLVNWAKKTVYWGDPVLALKIAFFDKLTEDDQKVVNKAVKRVFNKEFK